jgi:hypothetical protein
MRADEGSVAHNYLESLVATVPDYESPLTNFEAAIEKWYLDHRPQFQDSELVVFSLKHGFIGTTDLVLWTPTGLRIVDLKTRKAGTRGAYESDLIQCSAYKLAYEEMYGVPVHDTAVLLALDNGKYVYDERTVDPGIFLGLLDVYKRLEMEEL